MYSRLVSGFNATVVVVLFLAMAGCRSSQPDQSVSAALSNNNPQTFLETSFKVRGRDYRLCLPAELTDYAPAWNTQGGENPRLLPARAVLLARRALAKTFTDAAAWSLDSVEIREIPNIDPESGLPVSTGKWYYEICFRPPNERLVVQFVDQVCRQIKGPLTIVWDSIPIHGSKLMEDNLEKTGRLIVEQFPPYAPELNPIDKVWAYLKYGRLANYTPSNLTDLRTRLISELTELENRQEILAGCIRGAGLGRALD